MSVVLYQIEPLTEQELLALRRALYREHGYDHLGGARIKVDRAQRVGECDPSQTSSVEPS